MDQQQSKNTQLTVSDWVTYLCSEKYGLAGIAMNIFAILVALVALVYSTGTNNWGWAIASAVVVIGATAYVLKKTSPAWKQSRRAEKLLLRIMSGELKTEESIRLE